MQKDNNSSTQQPSTEQLILRAAEKEFLNKGFAGTRTTVIAEAAGVNHAMLHYYFRSKSKLFEMVISEKVASMAATFMINFDEKYSLEECIRRAVENHFEFVRSNPALPRFIITNVLGDDSLQQILRHKIEKVAVDAILSLQQKIDKCVERGECREIKAYNIVMDIISLNIFPFIASGMIEKLTKLTEIEDFEDFLNFRREENVQTILRKLLK